MATLDQTFTDHPPLDGITPASGVAFASAARTATPLPTIFGVPDDAEGMVVVIDTTAVTSTPSTVFTVEGVDRASGKTWVILTSAAIATVSTVVLRVSPNIAVSANLIAQDLLPAEVIVRAVHGNANSHTYSVGVHFTA